MAIIFENQTKLWKQEFFDFLKIQHLYGNEVPDHYVNSLFACAKHATLDEVNNRSVVQVRTLASCTGESQRSCSNQASATALVVPTAEQVSCKTSTQTSLCKDKVEGANPSGGLFDSFLDKVRIKLKGQCVSCSLCGDGCQVPFVDFTCIGCMRYIPLGDSQTKP